MAFDTVLNVAWLILGLSALVAMFSYARNRRPSLFRYVVVAMVFAALFPIISATDDLIRLQHLEQSRKQIPHGKTDTLVALYQAMESPMTTKAAKITFTAIYSSLTVSLCETYARGTTIEASGRAPPFRLA